MTTTGALPGPVAEPDVSFITWERLPAGREPVPAVSPDLAVEILSEGNTEPLSSDETAWAAQRLREQNKRGSARNCPAYSRAKKSSSSS
jgi:hypothetical protein